MLDWTDRSPDATFDLHGQSVLEAVANAERFLRAQAKARPGAIVRVITGRGRSGGGAPIRTRVRGLLRRLKESGSVVRDYALEEARRQLPGPTYGLSRNRFGRGGAAASPAVEDVAVHQAHRGNFLPPFQSPG